MGSERAAVRFCRMAAAWLVTVAVGCCVKLRDVMVAKSDSDIKNDSVGEDVREGNVKVLIDGVPERLPLMEDEADELAELLPLMEDEILGVFDPLVEGVTEPLLVMLVEGDTDALLD